MARGFNNLDRKEDSQLMKHNKRISYAIYEKHGAYNKEQAEYFFKKPLFGIGRSKKNGGNDSTDSDKENV